MIAARAERDEAAGVGAEAGDGRGRAPPLPDEPADAFLVAWHQALRDRTDEHRRPVSATGSNATPATWPTCSAASTAGRPPTRSSVGNCVTSLRLLNAVDWTEFFERASLVEAALRAEPTGVYARQEFATRDRYRQAVEQLAKAAKRDEVEVARLAVARAGRRDRPAPRPRRLLPRRRGPAEVRPRTRLPVPRSATAGARPCPTDPHAVYFGGIAARSRSLGRLRRGMAGRRPGRLGARWPPWPSLLPASDVAVGLVNYARLPGAAAAGAAEARLRGRHPGRLRAPSSSSPGC